MRCQNIIYIILYKKIFQLYTQKFKTILMNVKKFLILSKLVLTKAMFVSRKAVSGKPFSKLSCVCLSLEKLVNGKHFPVNGKYFLVNGKHIPVNFSKKKFDLVFRKVFSLQLCLFSGKWFPRNHFSNFLVFVCQQES